MKFCRIVLSLAFSIVLLAGCASSVVMAKSGDTPKNVATGNGSVSGYAADSALHDGTIVQLAPKSTTKVVPVAQKNAEQMYGVTVDPHQLSLTITDSKLAHEVYVATSGTYNVLVSNQDGTIKPGDYVRVSSIDGVGMNAGSSGAAVFGRAINGFDGKSNIVGSAALKETSGKASKTVAIGIIPVAINIQHNPQEKSTQANLPKNLQRVGEAIADKPITPVRIYLSMAIAGLSVITALVILYSGIRSGLIAVGRNPLSKKTIYRGLLEIILTAILILIIGLFAVYLLLKL